MTKIYTPNLFFAFNIILDSSNNLVYLLFLMLEFGVIFEILVLKNYGHLLRIFLV